MATPRTRSDCWATASTRGSTKPARWGVATPASLHVPPGPTATCDLTAGHSRGDRPAYQLLRIDGPESGSWTAELTGLDIPSEDGEPVMLSVYVAEPANLRPTASVSVRVEPDGDILSGTGSSDPDGDIVAYDRYLATSEQDVVVVGPEVVVAPPMSSETTVTLVVTDDGGLTDFATVRLVPADVKPGSDVNPIRTRDRGVTPFALLASPTFDASGIDSRTIRVGPGGAPVTREPSIEDVDGDGLLDLVLHPRTQELGVEVGDTQLCLTGRLPDRTDFQACDAVRVQ